MIKVRYRSNLLTDSLELNKNLVKSFSFYKCLADVTFCFYFVRIMLWYQVIYNRIFDKICNACYTILAVYATDC